MLNSYHQNIKLTIKISPTKFLDAKLNYVDGEFSYIIDKFRKADYTLHFINMVNDLIKSNNILKDSYNIPPNIF